MIPQIEVLFTVVTTGYFSSQESVRNRNYLSFLLRSKEHKEDDMELNSDKCSTNMVPHCTKELSLCFVPLKNCYGIDNLSLTEKTYKTIR